jgi:threonine dehydratase
VIGVCAAGAPAYARSFAAGRPVATETAETIADGMACRTPLADAVSIINRNAARVVTVDDGEIRFAMQALFSDTHNAAEGAGAAALAALLSDRNDVRGKRVALILTGGNVDRDIFAQVLAASAPAACE